MAKRKKVTKTRKRSSPREDKSPGYMIQIPEPALVRRDVLESLREVIIFMQSYEKFKNVQLRKTHLFSELKAELKELNSLLTTKLGYYFPKGKLRAINGESEEEIEEKEEQKYLQDKKSFQRSQAPAPSQVHSELDELESQLKDIESQLQSIQ